MKKSICFLFAIFFLQNSAFASDIFKFERIFPALQQPWYFDTPNGIAVDEYGFVYLVDTDNNRIQKYSIDGQFIAKWGGFNQPHGIVTDKMGFVYVTDSGNHRIRKFTTDGDFVREWKTDGFHTGITIDRKNFIYTIRTDDLCVYKYTSEGSFIKKWQIFNEEVTADIHLLIGIAADDKDFIYVSDIQNHLIRKFTADGDFIIQWGGKGDTPGLLNLPAGLSTDREGYVYVCDDNNDRVQKFDPNGNLITTWGGKGDVIGRFNTPIGIAVSKSGTVYVTDRNNHRVQVFDADGKFLNNWQSYGSEPGRFDRPEAVASDNSGNIYVADKNNNRIQKFGADGKYIITWNGENSTEGILKTPYGITVSGEDVYLADTLNHRIRRFGLNGEVKTGWGSLGSADGQFNLPLGVAVNKESDDKVYVYATDWKNYRIQKFDADGRFIRKWGERGDGNGKFEKPHGIAVYDGFVYVSDESYSRILKFDIDGNYIKQWGSFGTDDGKFRSPTNLTIFENYLYVADRDNHRIQKFTLDGNFAESIGTSGTAPGYFNSPVGLCFGTQGRLYVSESANHRIQVFNRNTTQKISKAVIVAGKRENDPLWDHTRLCANFAYRTFTHQGIGQENIRYLTSDTQSDLDFDGNPDTVFSPTNAEFKSAIEWAKDADQLVIYLVDHGGANDSGNGIFRLSSVETFDMSELNPLLDNLQQEKTADVIAVFDTCKSGLFLKPSQIASGKKRILISSTKPDEDAHFVAQGTGSFSYQFWSNIFNGKDVKTAFGNAANSLGILGDLQHPQSDANGDGLDDGNSDALAGVYIGSGSAISGENPLISEISQPQSINGTDTAKIAATITDIDGIARVWAMIRPPSYANETQTIIKNKPILELPFIELKSLSNNRYEGSYDGFTVSGTYSVAVFAQDKRGNTALPGITSVSVGSHVRRCAILVNGVSDTSRTIFEKNISDANNALKFQGYQDILIMSSSESPVTIKQLQDSIDTWASANTSELVLYMTGRGSSGYFQLNSTQNLSISELDQWLDKLQSQANIRIILIFDSDYSGGFLPLLMPDTGKSRILITSTSDDQPAPFPEGDQLSFSVFFWDSILNGESVGKSFFKAKEAIAFFAQRTEQYAPRMDDNGNGVGNEQSDGIYAINYILGAGIRLASDLSNVVYYRKTDKGIYLYVSDLNITGTVKKVWAVITPPAKDPYLYPDSGSPTPKSYHLTYDSETKQYGAEILSDDFVPDAGVYTAAVYAMNSNEIVSTVNAIPILIAQGKDIYEYDDSISYANTIIINDNKQYHNFHNAQDRDLLKFYAVSGQTYSIKTEYLGTGGTMRLELYNQRNILVDFRETSDAQKEIQWDWIAPVTGSGIYYLKIIPKDFSKDSLYTIQIYRPVGPFVGYINGTITDAATGALISEAALVTDADASAISRPNGRYTIIQEPGTFYMTIQAPGYENMSVPITVSEGGTSVVNVSLTQVQTPVPDIPVTPVTTLAPNFSAEPASGVAPLSVKFTDSSDVSGGAIAAYEWDFGDGTKSSDRNPSHNYDKPGTYTVTLKITASDGNSAIERKSGFVEVLQAALLKAEFDFNPKSGQAPLTVTFTDTSAGDIVGRQWYIGRESVSREKIFTYTFEQAGKYTIKLTISDPGAESSAEREIEVSPIPVVQPGMIRGRITDAQTGQTIYGARITTSRDKSVLSGDNGSYEIFQEPGYFSADISMQGYYMQHIPGIQISESQTLLLNIALKPVVPKPILKSPDSGSETAMTPTLRTEDFPAAEDYTHASTQWQIAEDAEFSRPIMDIRTSEYLTKLYVPPLILQSAETYLWRARFYDASGNSSLWSESRIFLTPLRDGNAIGKESVRTLIGNSSVSIGSSAVSATQAFLPEEIPDKRNKPSELPIGMISVRLNTAQPGDISIVRMYLSKTPPADSGWYMYDMTNGWIKAASDSDKSELRIKDGDIGDADGIENGIIVMLTGLAAASSDNVLPEIQPPSDDVGGCFIRTLIP